MAAVTYSTSKLEAWTTTVWTKPEMWAPLFHSLPSQVDPIIIQYLDKRTLEALLLTTRSSARHPIIKEAFPVFFKVEEMDYDPRVLVILRRCNINLAAIPEIRLPLTRKFYTDYITPPSDFTLPVGLTIARWRDQRNRIGFALRIQGRNLPIVASNGSGLRLHDFSGLIIVHQRGEGNHSSWVRTGRESFYVAHFHHLQHSLSHPNHFRDSPNCAGGCPPIDPYDSAANMRFLENMLTNTDPAFRLCGAPDYAVSRLPISVAAAREALTTTPAPSAATRAAHARTGLRSRCREVATDIYNIFFNRRYLEQVYDLFAHIQ